MKTKFSPILKVRKLEIEKIENQLLSYKNQKRKAKSELSNLMDDLKKMEIAKKGSITELKRSFFLISSLQNSIAQQKEYINLLDNQIKSTQKLLQKATIEYEKIKYLHDIEVKKVLEKIKKMEIKELDEVASQLFVTRKKR